MDFVGDGFDQGFEEVRGYPTISLFVQLGVGELRCAIDRHEQVELALLGSHLGNVDVKVADGIGLELLLGGLVALRLRQTADPMQLEATMQGGSCQVWNGGLQGIKAIVEWQQCVFTEGDDQRFFLLAKNRRARLPRPHVGIADRTASAPFGHGLWIDAVAGGELPQARA